MPTITVTESPEAHIINRLSYIASLRKSLDDEYEILVKQLKRSNKHNFKDAACEYRTKQGSVLNITERLGAEIPISVEAAKKILEENNKKRLFSSVVSINMKLLRTVLGDAVMRKIVKRKKPIYVLSFSKE